MHSWSCSPQPQTLQGVCVCVCVCWLLRRWSSLRGRSWRCVASNWAYNEHSTALICLTFKLSPNTKGISVALYEANVPADKHKALAHADKHTRNESTPEREIRLTSPLWVPCCGSSGVSPVCAERESRS